VYFSKKNCQENLFHYNLTRTTSTVHADQYTFLTMSRSVLLRMRNVTDKSCTENQNTHFVSNNFFYINRAVFEIMWENAVQPDRPQMTTWRMRTAWWITKATNTHSQYVILIAFPLQQWLQERVLRYTYIVCLLLSTYKKTSGLCFTLSDDTVLPKSKSRFIKPCHSI